jgi:hypothetical protein
VNARAVMIAKIATGEIENAPEDDGKDPAAMALGKLWSAEDIVTLLDARDERKLGLES